MGQQRMLKIIRSKERNIRQIEIHTAEPLIPGLSHLEVEIANLKKYEFPGHKILVELIQAGGEAVLSAVHKPMNSVWKNEKLPEQWKDCNCST
jgi:hypothetical protein